MTFIHRIRCLSSDVNHHANNRALAYAVHSDFTREGPFNWLQSTIKHAAEVERLSRWQGSHCQQLAATERSPQGSSCGVHGTSTIPARDQVRLRMDLPTGGRTELGRYVYNHEHRWCYLNHQEPKELLLFEQFDSTMDEQGGRTLAHSAVVDREQDGSGDLGRVLVLRSRCLCYPELRERREKRDVCKPQGNFR